MTAPKVHRAPITMNHGMPRSTQTNPVENPLEPCRDRFETSKKTRQTPAHTHTHTHTHNRRGVVGMPRSSPRRPMGEGGAVT